MKARLLTRIPRHAENIQISKDSKQIEDELNTKLILLVSSLQKLQKQGQYDTIYSIEYKNKIYSAIRRAVEKVYRSAGNYAATFISRDYFTTKADINTIAEISQTYTEILFRRIQRFVISDTNTKKIRPEFIVGMTTASLTQDTMRQAIIAKSQQIVNPVILTTAAEDDIEPTTEPLTEPSIVYVWVTSQDDKVCPICSANEGQVWPMDNSTEIPEIPDGTHPNCRCVIQLAEAEFL